MSLPTQPRRATLQPRPCAAQVVDEEETLVVFAAMLRKSAVLGKGKGKNRAVGAKPKGR